MAINPNDKKGWRSIVILNEILNGRVFKTIFNGDDKILEPLMIDLMASGYLNIYGDHYVITGKGKKSYDLFMDKYQEFLKVYDVYSFVDLATGEFAFSKFFEFETDEAWNLYKAQERFQDLRIAVGIFKGINVSELVFMSFISENRFDTQKTGWQIDLMADLIWDEIDMICETAIKQEQLGEGAIENIIVQGSTIMVDLVKTEWEKNKREEEERWENNGHVKGPNGWTDGEPVGEVVTTTETIVEEVVEEDPEWVYYRSYLDPFFVPIFWYDPIITW